MRKWRAKRSSVLCPPNMPPKPPVATLAECASAPPDPEYLKLLLPYREAIQKLALAARKLSS